MLIAFEGIDGSGKTSVCKSLAEDLESSGHSVLVVSRASFMDDAARPGTGLNRMASDAKPERRLGPLSYCTAHCAELAFLWEKTVQPALGAGKIIIADRYKYTAFVRDTIRGVKREYVEALYSFSPDADLVFCLDTEPKTALERKKAANAKLSTYEAGLDLFPDLGTDSAFIALQSLCRRNYPSVLPKDKTIIVNSMARLEDVRQTVREHALCLIDKATAFR
jgi:dTMP kinase